MTIHLDEAKIADGLAHVRNSPVGVGRVEMLVRRPSNLAREVVQQARFTEDHGMEGDNWLTRGSKRTPDGSAHPDRQVAVTNARFLDLVSAGNRERWPLAGDQLVVDLDLSTAAVMPGMRVRAGTAVFEVTDAQHNGCARYAERYGRPAIEATAAEEGRRLRLRGVYFRVVEPGTVHLGDRIVVDD